jgi:hypothetical protein
MILSHSHRFIFIKTRKTAGTSIEVFLSQHCGPEDVFTPIDPPLPQHQPRNFRGLWNPLPELQKNGWGASWPRIWQDLVQRRKFYNHIPARVAQQRMAPGLWQNYLSFCVERNPWDKTLSHYAMVNQRLGGNMSLDDYFDYGLFCTDFDKYTDAAGRLLVTAVLRYENLQQELTQIFGQLGIPFDGNLGVRAKSDYRKDRRPYQAVYTPAQRDFVARHFAREIALFGYQF